MFNSIRPENTISECRCSQLRTQSEKKQEYVGNLPKQVFRTHFSVTVFWQLPNSMINQHVLKHCKWVKIESAHRRFLPTHTFPKIWKSQLRVQFSRKWWARAFLPIYIGFLFLSHLVALSRAAVKKHGNTLVSLERNFVQEKIFSRTY